MPNVIQYHEKDKIDYRILFGEQKERLLIMYFLHMFFTRLLEHVYH
jgi:hypothetical protein